MDRKHLADLPIFVIIGRRAVTAEQLHELRTDSPSNKVRRRLIRKIKQKCWERYAGYSTIGGQMFVNLYGGKSIHINAMGAISWAKVNPC